MPSEIEYINYKEFVETLSTTESPDVTDKEVVSNETNGPRAVPSNARALANEQSEGKIKVFGENYAGYFDIENLAKIQRSQIYDNYAQNIDDLNKATVNSTYIVQRTANTTTANFPSDYGIEAAIGLLCVYKGKYASGADNFQILQVLTKLRTGEIWRRTYNGYSNSWTSWSKSDSLPDTVFRASESQIFDNYSQNLDGLNNAVKNTAYIVQRTANTTTANFPSDYGTDGSLGLLCVYKGKYGSGNDDYQLLQVLTKLKTGEIWRRMYTRNTNTWTDWSKSSIADSLPDTVFRASESQIFDNYVQNLDSLNNAVKNTAYIVQRTENTTTANFPSDYGTEAALGLLCVYKGKYGQWDNEYQFLQVLTKLRTGEIWRRTYDARTTTWTSWSKSNPPISSNEYHIGAGQTYTTVRAGIAAAMSSNNSVVYIHPGVYDLVTEFSDSISSDMGVVGNPLGKGITVICYDGVKINANFDFSSGYSEAEKNAIYRNFNPFYSVDGNFRIVNMNIESTNTRYCVHDENGGSGDHIHEYINCKMKHNVDYYNGNEKYIQCIGGGLGEHTTIVIDGGYYESNTSIGLTSVDGGDVNYAQQPISYHNGNNANCESSITLRNVYFADKGYLRISDYGPSTKLSKVYASGCRFAYPILHKYETPNLGHDNFVVTADWNNDIANNGSWNIAADGYTATWAPS